MNEIVLQIAAPGMYVSPLIGGRFQILETEFVSGSFYVYDASKGDNARDKNGAIQYFASLEEAEVFCGMKPKAAKAPKVKAEPKAKVAKAPKPAKVKAEPKEKVKAVKSVTTKAELALVLFKENPAMTNAELMQLFMDKLSMTKLGARTYVYNVRKQAAQ